jgi:diguanylate cyclase (GGDEF)-like protein
MKKPSASSLITVISLLLFVMNVVIASYIHTLHARLTNDAQLINELGVIRGMAQRIVKLELAGSGQCRDECLDRVDAIFLRYLDDSENRQYNFDPELYHNFNALNQEWHELRQAVTAFGSESGPTRQELLARSERMWTSSNLLVAEKAANTNAKLVSFNLFYYYALFLLLSSVILYLSARIAVRRAEIDSTHDPLTRAFNRNRFDQDMLEEMYRFERSRTPFSLCLLDIDLFKDVNDTHGHAEGDKVLRKLTGVIRDHVRKIDFFYRVGGEEFALILPGTSQAEALVLAEKVRRIVEEKFSDDKTPITVSLGIAAYRDGMTPQELYARADQALYRAKETGRNKVVASRQDTRQEDKP